jgi:hypothetical protein
VLLIISLYNVSLQRLFTTSLYNVSLQRLFTTSLYNVSLQRLFTTSLYNVSLQRLFTTSLYNVSLQRRLVTSVAHCRVASIHYSISTSQMASIGCCGLSLSKRLTWLRHEYPVASILLLFRAAFFTGLDQLKS